MTSTIRTRFITSVALLIGAVLAAPVAASATTSPTPPANINPIGVTLGMETHPGEGINHFATIETWVDWQSGQLILAGTKNGLGRTAVDDHLKVTAIHPDGTKQLAFEVDYGEKCSSDGPTPFQPYDLGPALRPGRNLLVFDFNDACGGVVSSSALWLVPKPASGAFTNPPLRHNSTDSPDFSLSGGYGPESNLNLGSVSQEISFGTGYTSGPYNLAQTEAGNGSTAIHGVLKLVVHHNDGTVSTGRYGQTGGCTTSEIIPVTDVSNLFKVGFNQVVAYFQPTCGAPFYNSGMWLSRA